MIDRKAKDRRHPSYQSMPERIGWNRARGEKASLVLGDESTDGTIVGTLNIVREKTGGEFLHPPMIGDTLTTFPFPRAGIISAVALCLVLL